MKERSQGNRIHKLHIIVLVGIIFLSNSVYAHNFKSEAKYLGNEGVLVTSGQTKILFDPFFHNSYGRYTLVPEAMREAIFENQAPFDNIEAIFISHAHGDHFDAKDVLEYLQRYPKVKLYAPVQAIEAVRQLQDSQKTVSQFFPISLEFKQAPMTIKEGGVLVEAVRIPHAGWPQRANIQNIVFRVTLGSTDTNKVTVMHLGDADSDDQHFLPFDRFWQLRESDMAFPPFWFMLSDAGKAIMHNRLNSKRNVGIHMDEKMAEQLKKLPSEFFFTPGKTLKIEHNH